MKGLAIAAATVGIALIVLMSVRETMFVDVSSGRAMSQTSLFGLALKSSVRETAFSTAWLTNAVPHKEPRWEMESSTPIIHRVSPNTAYLGVFGWEDAVMYAFELCPVDSSLRKGVMQRFLNLLADDPEAAKKFATELQAFTAASPNRHFSDTNAPSWFTE